MTPVFNSSLLHGDTHTHNTMTSSTFVIVKETVSGYATTCGRRCGESSPGAKGLAISPVSRSQRNMTTEVRPEGSRYHHRQLAPSAPRMWGGSPSQRGHRTKENRQSSPWDAHMIGCRVCGAVERTVWWGRVMWHSQVWWLSDPHKNLLKGLKECS